MGQLVTGGDLGVAVAIVIRLTQVGGGIDLAALGIEGAIDGEEAVGGHPFIVQEAGQQGEAGTIRDVQGHARRQVGALVVGAIQHAVALFIECNHAIAAVVGQIVGEIDPDLTQIPVAQLQIDQALRGRGGALADGIDHAAGRRLAVEDGGRALEQLHAFQTKWLRGPDIVAGAEQAVAIKVLGGIEATHLEPVGVVVRAIETGEHAGAVAHGLVELLHGVLIQLLAVDHGDGAGGLGHGHLDLHGGAGDHHGFSRLGQLFIRLFSSQHRQARQQAGERQQLGPPLSHHCILGIFLRNHISVSNINELYFGFLLWVPNAAGLPDSLGE